MSRKFGAWLICAAAFLFFAFARAETPMQLTLSINTGELVAPGEATVSMDMLNTSDTKITSIRLSAVNGEDDEEIGTLLPGERRSYAAVIFVNQKQLDAGAVELLITYETKDGSYRQRESLGVKQIPAIAQISITRRVSPECARPGETVTAAYEVQNIGNVPLHTIVLSDALGGYTGRHDALLPGETAAFINEAVVSQTVSSAPEVSFVSSASGTTYKNGLAPFAITVREAALRVSVASSSPSVAYGARAKFEVTVENDGPFSYTGLVLSEPTLGDAGDIPYSLKAGESFTRVFTTGDLYRASGYTFALAARDSGGKPVTVMASEVFIDVAPYDAFVAPFISASVDHDHISVGGTLHFTVTVSGASVNLRDVRVYEKTRGDVRVLTVLPAAENTVLTCAYRIDEAAEVRFCVDYPFPDGSLRTAEAEPVRIRFSRSGDVPVSARPDALFSVRGRSGQTAGILLASSAVVIIVIALMLARRLWQMRGRTRKDPMERTAKFAPVRRDGGKETK